ncbi:MAG TPA: transcriptional regulator [Anaerolineales bacterium]|nr:transcriptional regulator [Anaerolineales bacterium]
MSADLRSISGVDRLIHEPSRTIILAVLSAVESADFLYLQRETGLTKGNLSVHLSKLEEAGYIVIEKTYRGKVPLTLCRMTEDGRKAFKEYRAQLKSFVDQTRT